MDSTPPLALDRFFRSTRHIVELDRPAQDRVFAALKKLADEQMRTDLGACLRTADCMQSLAEHTRLPEHAALALLALANARSIGQGEFQQALALYDQAAGLYHAAGLTLLEAQAQIGRVSVLAILGRYHEALASARWALAVFEQHGERFQQARLTVNLATIYGRMGQDGESLTLFEQAQEIYHRLGEENEPHWLRLELNRAVALRNLGRFDEALQVGQSARERFTRLGMTVAAARAQQGVAVTCLVIGRYNEALDMLEDTREILAADGRVRDALLVELFLTDCLLQLRRFPDVLEKTSRLRAAFQGLGAGSDAGQAILNEAAAQAGLGRYTEAQSALVDALQIFQAAANALAVAHANLQRSAVFLSQNLPQAALELARACEDVYHRLELPVWQARACLLAARAALAIDMDQLAREALQRALEIGEAHHLPTLIYPAHQLAGELAIRQGLPEQGLASLETAIDNLEQLCGRLMVEYRAGFLEDKERLYEDAVDLSLQLTRPVHGLMLAERAKSRALLDLLAHHLDLGLSPRSPADQPLVDELLRLRQERDHLYRRWEGGEGYGQRGESAALQDFQVTVEARVQELEQRITSLWHRLLVRNADYARDAALWQVRAEPVQDVLSEDTRLVEYFVVHGRLIAFLVSPQAVQVFRLPVSIADVQRLLQMLWLNLRSVPLDHDRRRIAALEANARGLLSRLYQACHAPLVEALAGANRLIIVPHGALHYLPFQALHDGTAYLLERCEISYLPGSSLLRYLHGRPASLEQPNDLLAVGCSFQSRLPFAVSEATEIAGLWPGRLLVERQATLAAVRQAAQSCRILHLAAHGDFRPDNPLFSGLALHDGWLTTLDIFNLRLQAALVTLSACQTGRSVVGGGDELLGLMRAFLAAGAVSLVSTLWAVEDHSTARLMHTFYRQLADGAARGAALRSAQLGLLRTVEYQHPYFWSAFFLVGEAGPL
jgi:CHAT domain-containing protein/tetratricopeptide (TPR) repeat protein